MTKKYILVMGFCIFFWALGYTLMGITRDFDRAAVYRVIGLIGTDAFLSAELYFLNYRAINHKGVETVIHFTYTIMGILDVIFFGNPVCDTFVRLGLRTCYRANTVWQRQYHNIYIIIIVLSLFLAWNILRKKMGIKRERKNLTLLFISNIIFLLSIIPDTILTLLGKLSWPSSVVGAFLVYSIFQYIGRVYSAFDISERDIKKFIYDYAHLGVLAFDLQNHLVEANRYARGLIGIRNIDGDISLNDIFELSNEESQDVFYKVYAGEDVEIELKTKFEGNYCLAHFHAEKDEFGDRTAIFLTILDRKREKEMIKELSELNEAKTYFLANMSHEIRTPVNSLLGMDEMILKTSSEPRILNYAENIKNSCKLLISIINDILDFSKIESGELSLNNAEYNLGSMISSLVLMIEERTYKKGLSMNIDIDEELPVRLFGDEMRLRQIITNLLTNAVKYTDYGTVTLSIKGGEKKEDRVELIIDVIDTGKGIKREDQKKLFAAFQRVDEKRNRHIEGTGLGLSISSHFVSLMGGTISVESEYGKGSDFKVTVFQGIADETPIGDYKINLRSEEEKSASKEIILAPRARVLIVDDNQMNLEVAALLLEETKMQIDTALCGLDALSLMRENEYNIIFLDHMMPKMDGIELLLNMKKEGIQEKVPVIVLTANAIAGAREMYISKGFDDYLSKPIIIEELNKMLKKYLPSELIMKMEVTG